MALLLLASCREKETPEDPERPSIRVELLSVNAFQAGISVNCLHSVSVRYGIGLSEAEAGVLNHSVETGSTGPTQFSFVINDLTPLTDYILCAKGIGPDGEEGPVQTLRFSTVKGPDGLYAWEKARSGVPSFADISLVTMGWHNANPPAWAQERFASHVKYGDRWLFDAFLCIDGTSSRGLSYSIANGRMSADRQAWEELLEAWLGNDGALRKLDAAISAAGTPPRPRYVVMSIPDPVMFQYFSDRSSSTKYWGSLDGRKLDFSLPEDQEAACRWYMDRCRERFNSLHLQHVELAGFYILSEELHLAPAFYESAGLSYSSSDTWNYQYKHWEELVPWVASYAHSCNEGLWWIPYHLAPGYRAWRQLGFDGVFMQPNYYWDHDKISHPLVDTKQALKQYRLGMELEYSLVASVMADGRSGPDGSGAPTFYAKDVPLLRSRVREYMNAYKSTGLYGELPVAVYSGTDAWHQLATSPDADDKAMFQEICTFIIDSPLKK